MSKAPAMPMYWDAYLADTTHLTTEEHGAYLLLLAAMWRRNGTVPDNDADNARILGLTKAKWRKIKARLSDLLTIQDGVISQKKLQKTWKKTQEKIQTNRANGAKGGRPKGNENKDMAKADGSVSDSRTLTLPEPEPEPSKSSVSKDTGAEAPPDPKKIAFDSGVKLLGDAGTSPKQSRSIIGKWIKAHGEGDVISALGKAQREGAIDPVAFCEGVFRHQSRKAAPEGKTNNGYFGNIPEHN